VNCLGYSSQISEEHGELELKPYYSMAISAIEKRLSPKKLIK
jgi:hypothetical protein